MLESGNIIFGYFKPYSTNPEVISTSFRFSFYGPDFGEAISTGAIATAQSLAHSK